MVICVVELQIICKLIDTGNYGFLEANNITEEHFKDTGYEAEYQFIKEHYEQYGNVPDRATFLAKFPDIEFVEVSESDQYLADTINEERLFRQSVPIVKNIAKLLKTDSNAAVEYMLQSVKNLQPNYNLGGVDLIADATQRLEHLKERIQQQDEWYFSSGFPELDNVIHGFKRGEELAVIFARTNQGKSWILEKIISHIWKTGFNVGYISPEMGADSIGYRFDTLYKGFSNKDLAWGTKNVNVEEYEAYIEELKKHDNKFIVATPEDFNRRITVTKLRNFVKQHKLEALAIDGITYITDERGKNKDNKTTSLTNISEDLTQLSNELSIPVFIVVQSNRSGVVDAEKDGVPELESIRDSDGIAHNATKVLSLRQKDDYIELGVKKQRDGKVGTILKYLWDINTGEFTYVPAYDEGPKEEPERQRERKKAIGKDVF